MFDLIRNKYPDGILPWQTVDLNRLGSKCDGKVWSKTFNARYASGITWYKAIERYNRPLGDVWKKLSIDSEGSEFMRETRKRLDLVVGHFVTAFPSLSISIASTSKESMPISARSIATSI